MTAILIAALAVGLGAALAFLPGLGPRTLGPIRTFALVAAVAVVAAHLLPEALEAIGAFALAGFALGLVVPVLGERVLHRHHHGSESHGVAFEIGYAGLLVHSAGDGVAMLAFSREGSLQIAVVGAFAAHIVPLTTVIVLHVARTKGARAAALRAAGIAAATFGGVIIGSLVPEVQFSRFEPWIAAIAGGMLLHVIAHDFDADSPTTPVMRTFDLLAGLAAILLVVGVQVNLQSPFFTTLAWLGLWSAPPMLLGLAASALVQVLLGDLPDGSKKGVFQGLTAAARSPLAGYDVLTPARSLVARNAPASFVAAFAIAGPSLGLEALALDWRFFGAPLAFTRLAGALLVAALAAGVIGWRASRSAAARIDEDCDHMHEKDPGYELDREHDHLIDQAKHAHRSWIEALDDAAHHASPWMLAGLIVAAAVAIELPEGSLAELGSIAGLIALAAAVPAYLWPAAATPLAAVLIRAGIPPGWLIAALILGPSIHLAKLTLIERAYGTIAAFVAAIVIGGAAVAIALLVNLWSPIIPAPGETQALTLGAAVILAVLALRSLWRSGVRRWLAALGFGGAPDLGGHHHHHHTTR